MGFFFISNIPSGLCTTVSDSVVLEYQGEEVIKVTPKINIEWSFKGSNPNVNITLDSYSESCYLAHSWHRVVSEDHVSDSGSWTVAGHSICDPSEQDTVPPFYFVFSNHDPDQENTTVSYTLNVDPLIIPGYNGFIVISSLSIVVIIIIRNKIKTK
jgi:hypothetical protein